MYKVPVSGSQLPTSVPRMSRQKTIERISSPRQFACHVEPRRRGRVVKNPALIVHEITDSRVRTKTDALGFEQKLDLK